MKALVIGSGGREHALCWKLKQSKLLKELYCAPGNPGISKLAENIALKVDDISGLVEFAKSKAIDLTIIGPEYPLTLGLADSLHAAGLNVFGPNREAAKLESSKSFAKQIMQKVGVPTAQAKTCPDFETAALYVSQHGAPCVLKVDGLAAGKGVIVCKTLEEAQTGLSELYRQFPNCVVVVEDFLSGKEASFIIATDGERIISFAAAHDYKRIGEGDSGPNTGGMGTVCPTPNLTSAEEQWVIQKVMQPVVAEMRARRTPFVGFLYAGLMLGANNEINVLEFNARMGDPECQSILRRMDSDLFELLYGLARGQEVTEPKWRKDSCVCVVLAAAGYPDNPKSGDEISGVEQAESLSEVVVFQAGTALNSKGQLITNGGRVLGVTACGPNVEQARSQAFKACDMIQFRGRQLRRDIGALTH